jgi:hypothetical protein
MDYRLWATLSATCVLMVSTAFFFQAPRTSVPHLRVLGVRAVSRGIPYEMRDINRAHQFIECLMSSVRFRNQRRHGYVALLAAHATSISALLVLVYTNNMCRVWAEVRFASIEWHETRQDYFHQSRI